MPVLDKILPENLDPFVRNLINGLVFVHIAAFLLWVYLVMRSSTKTQTEEFRDQFRKLEREVKHKQGKQE
jgi:hypothetical protein